MTKLVIALAMLGCTKEPPSASCDTAGDGVKAYWSAKAGSATNDTERQHAMAMGDGTAVGMVRHCKADAWSVEVVTCFHDPSEAALARCMKRLTAEQQQKLSSDLGK